MALVRPYLWPPRMMAVEDCFSWGPSCAGNSVPLLGHSCDLLKGRWIHSWDFVRGCWWRAKGEGFSLRGNKILEATAVHAKVHRGEVTLVAVNHEALIQEAVVTFGEIVEGNDVGDCLLAEPHHIMMAAIHFGSVAGSHRRAAIAVEVETLGRPGDGQPVLWVILNGDWE
jgi:hypothetical protein